MGFPTEPLAELDRVEQGMATFGLYVDGEFVEEFVREADSVPDAWEPGDVFAVELDGGDVVDLTHDPELEEQYHDHMSNLF